LGWLLVVGLVVGSWVGCWLLGGWLVGCYLLFVICRLFLCWFDILYFQVADFPFSSKDAPKWEKMMKLKSKIEAIYDMSLYVPDQANASGGMHSLVMHRK